MLAILVRGDIEQHDVRVLLDLLDHDLAAIGRDVKVPDVETGLEVCQLFRDACLEINRPEILVPDLSPQQEHRSLTGNEGHVVKSAAIAGDRAAAAERALNCSFNLLDDTAAEGLASDNLFASNFGQASQFVDPRRAMVGVRLMFGQ